MPVRHNYIKRVIVDGALWCALCVLLIVGFVNQSAVKRYSPVSLRYSTPISGQAAYAARQYSIAQSGEAPFWPMFWKEYKASLSSEFVSVDTDCIAFSGDASLVWPADYICGAAPSVVDDTGCAVSETLAWRLWGSADVVGMTVEADGDTRVVRGVFKGNDELALISFRDEDTAPNWNVVDLTGGPNDAVRSDAESFAQAAGLGKPDAIVMKGPSSISRVLAIFPLLILAFYAAALIIGFVRKRFPAARKPVFYICIILFAVALPLILGAMPAWSVPTRWSDFSFWVSLLKKAASGLRGFLQTAPQLRDVELRMLLIKQAGISLISICCALSVCFRWRLSHGFISDIYGAGSESIEIQ